MPQNPTYSCYLGAHGWQHANWHGQFYPEDLPADWQLAYYNNFFSCVYLTHSEWAGVALTTWRQRLDDMQPQFRLVLQTAGPLGAHEKALFELLEPHIGFCDGSAPAHFANSGFLIWFASGLELKQLAHEINVARAAAAPVYLISRDAGLGAIEQVRTLLEILGC